MSWLWIPQAADRFFCKNHSCIKADDWEVSCNMENILHYSFAGLWIQEVNLSSIVPRHTSTIVSVVNVTSVAIAEVYALKYNGTVRVVVIVIFKPYTNIWIPGKIFAIKCVRRRWKISTLNKKVWAVYNPFAVHTSVVWNHIRSKTNTALPQTCAEIWKCIPTTNVFCNVIVIQRVCRCSCFWITAKLFDAFWSIWTAPQTDKP